MKITNFHADADLVGRRVRICWEFVFEGENLAAIPRVVLRRKSRDFEFPGFSPSPDFVVFDSNAFPPPGSKGSDVSGWQERDGDSQIVTSVESATKVVSGRMVETGRRTTSTTFNGAATPLRRRVEFLDTGTDGGGLAPGITLYYELLVDPGTPAVQRFQTTTTPTDVHGMGRALYQMLPEVYRRHDVIAGPEMAGAEGIPEANTRAGQLRRFVDLFGVGFDSMRSTAEGLLNIHDIDNVTYKFLPLLSRWIGWDLSYDGSIPIQRHEVKYAAALYRITGTTPGCMIWARRLSGWPARVKEFYRNVFFTNDVGEKDDPAHKGSRTVNTADPAVVAAIGTFGDQVQYSYDTGTSDADFYAYNVVGLFVQPGAEETVDSVNRKLLKLKNSFALFLPVNIRGVIVLEMPAQKDTQTATANLLNQIVERGS